MGGTRTDENGLYTIRGILPGAAYIRTNASDTGLNYVDEFWDDAVDCNDATAITVVAGAEETGKDFFLETGGSISGHVYRANGTTPIADANVDIYSDRCYNGHMCGVRTDGDGYFEFKGLPIGGRYILRAESGQSGQPFVAEWYDNVPDNDCNAALFVNVGETADFGLALGAGVEGVVRKENGDPITGVSVGVDIIQGDPCGSHQYVAGAWSNPDDGTFVSSGVLPGTYYIRSSSWESNYVSEWWSGANSSKDCSEAKEITVESADILPGVTFNLELGGSISGHVYNTATNDPISDLHVFASEETCGGYWLGGYHTDENGYYIIYGIRPGAAYLQITITGCYLCRVEVLQVRRLFDPCRVVNHRNYYI